MTKPEDGSWDDATQHDDGAQMDGDDQPTMRANDEHVAALRRERMKQRMIDDAATSGRGRTTAQGLQDKTRTPALGVADMSTIPQDAPTPPAGLVALERDPLLDVKPVHHTDRGIPVQPDPSSTNRGIPVAPRAPGSSVPPSSPSSSSPDIASALYAAAGDLEPSSTARGIPVQPAIAKGRVQTEDGVILLDRVSGNAPTGTTPRRSESASGGVVVVATGLEADRIRRLCHVNSLLVPVMSSLSIAHEAMFVVVIGEPSPPAPERVVHVVRPSVTDKQLVDLLRALVTGYVVAEPPAASGELDPRVLESAQRIAKLDDRGAIEMIAVEAITALVGADRAHCLFFDPSNGALWSEGTRLTLGDTRRAIAGFVGWAAYTGQAMHSEPAGDDPRYLQELDDPDGKAQSRILVQPIVGGDRRSHAVLVAARRWRHDPFKREDIARLRTFAALVAPTLDLVAPAPESRKPRTTIPGALKNAQTAALIDPPRTKPPTGPSPLTAPRHRPPSSPIVDDAGDASDSKRLRATSQPPTTSNTGRTRAPTGETRPGPAQTNSSSAAPRTRGPTDETRPEGSRPPTGPNPLAKSRPPTGPSPVASSRPATGPNPVASGRAATGPVVRPSAPLVEKLPLPAPRHPPSAPPSPAMTVPMVHRVAIVATDDEHDRARRVAKTCGLEIALASITDDAPTNARVITLGLPWSPDLDPRVIYVARANISNDHLADLMTAVASGKALATTEQPGKPNNPTEARRAQIAFAGSRTFAAAYDFVSAEASAITTLRELLDADRAYFLLYDDTTGALSSPNRKLSKGDNRRSIAGMAGWSALTGRASQTERGAADPRWLGPIDDPDGDSNSQLLVQPVLRTDQRVQAIIIAARRPRRPGFTDIDMTLAERFASLVSPLLEQLHQHVESQKLIGDTTGNAKAARKSMSPLQRLLARVKKLFGR